MGANRLVTLDWTDSSNEQGFDVERAAKVKNLEFARIATVDEMLESLAQPVAAAEPA